jgi:hypothetical protein
MPFRSILVDCNSWIRSRTKPAKCANKAAEKLALGLEGGPFKPFFGLSGVHFQPKMYPTQAELEWATLTATFSATCLAPAALPIQLLQSTSGVPKPELPLRECSGATCPRHSWRTWRRSLWSSWRSADKFIRLGPALRLSHAGRGIRWSGQSVSPLNPFRMRT